MLLSVVVITLNEAERIGRLLDALLQQDAGRTDWEILVVDGGSGDRTCEIVRAYGARHPRVRLRAEARRGYGYQRNVGAREARGKYVLFLSADVSPTHNLIAKYIQAFVTGVDIIQGTAIDVSLGRGRLGRTLCKFRAHVYRSKSEVPQRSMGLSEFSTINVAISKDVLLEVPFDEVLDAVEDKEFYLRVRASTSQIRIRSAVVHHEFRDSLVEFYTRLHREAKVIGFLSARRASFVEAAGLFGWGKISATLWIGSAMSAAAVSAVSASPQVAAPLAFLIGWLAISWCCSFDVLRRQDHGVVDFLYEIMVIPILLLAVAFGFSQGYMIGKVRELLSRKHRARI